MPKPTPPVDPRDAGAVLAEFRNRRYGYLPQWNPPDKSAGAAIGQVFSRFVAATLQRLNQAPAKDKLAFLDLLGLRLIPAQAARVPIVFQLGKDAPDTSAPEGTQVAAPPPPGSTQQVVFSIERDAGISAGSLTEVVSLWPGRDQYIDHSAAHQAGRPFTVFENLQLRQTEHILYLAHSTLLAFAGTTHLRVVFDLAQGSSAPLAIAWEYWDGKVWRGFKDNRPSCLEAVEAGHDGTNGLSTDGSVHLDADGAQAVQTSVNGVQSYWIRGRLTQSLLPDPGQLLPEVESIRLVTQIDRRLELKITAQPGPASGLSVLDDSGQFIDAASVTISEARNPASIVASVTTNDQGPLDLTPSPTIGTIYRFEVVLQQGVTGVAFAPYSDPLALVVKVEGLLPEKAIVDGKAVDLTKAFYPLGQSPTVGTALYFKHGEVFSKPGATVDLYLAPTPPAAPNPPAASTPPASTGQSPDPNSISHSISWEYWNGFDWTLLLQSAFSNSASGDFTLNEIVSFQVPADMVATKVNNDEGLWIRARLTSGGYGVTRTITFPRRTDPPTLTYIEPQPPILGVLRLGYSWPQGPFAIERVVTRNDFQFEDHTDEASLPGSTFAPYKPIGEVTPAVYLGFDRQLPVNNFGMYLDVVEIAGQGAGPALVWEYWNGGGWQGVVVEDETQQLQLPGMLSFIPAADSHSLARFDRPLFWLRGRLKEDGPPTEATINRIYPNAVWASQWQTITSAPLGASTGSPDQLFQFTQIPVLAGQTIDVQELSGPRANTEWRSIALEIAAGDSRLVTELEQQLASEGDQAEVAAGGLRLIRDKTKKVTAVFVRWEEVESFFDSTPSDRHYVLDHATGRLFFGDGDSGKIPPAAAAIQASRFRSGGGLAGNVAAATVTQLLGSVAGVQGITNPRAAEGGADGETLAAYSRRAPLSLRNRGRAITPRDYETMAHEASAGVAVARAIPTRNPAGLTLAGWVTVIIIPESQEARPMPSFGLRDAVRRHLERYAPGDIAAGHKIDVIGPTYLPIDVTATLAPKDPSQTGTVELNAVRALAEFLHPLRGGPDGLGWDLGRGVYASDVASVVGGAAGVDYVEELSLFVNGVLQGDHVAVPPDQIVVAGQLKLNLIPPEGR